MITKFKKPEGFFKVICTDKDGKIKWIDEFHNITTDEGVTAILDIMFSKGTQVLTWYIGLKGTGQVPTALWNAAGIGSQFTEFTDYSQAARVEWVEPGVSSKSITNNASPASFDITGPGTLYGAFLISVSTKGATTGKLWCISDFTASRQVINGDNIKVIYTINGADA